MTVSLTMHARHSTVLGNNFILLPPTDAGGCMRGGLGGLWRPNEGGGALFPSIRHLIVQKGVLHW